MGEQTYTVKAIKFRRGVKVPGIIYLDGDGPGAATAVLSRSNSPDDADESDVEVEPGDFVLLDKQGRAVEVLSKETFKRIAIRQYG